MKIGIPKETLPGEARVALIPSAIAQFKRENHEILVESSAGAASSFSDDQYKHAGAHIVKDAAALYRESDVIFKVQPLQKAKPKGKHEASLLKEHAVYFGYMAPLANLDTVTTFLKKKVTSFSMEYVPRITRAQSMDALSSMATVAGYKAVLLATEKSGKMFPLLMTAAGTIPPATVLILGAGVAGLQAIATAKRLGARVEAFDPRPAVKEQVKSLGASFIDMEVTEDAETAGGYAKELSAEFLKKEQEAIAARLPKVDIVISTAQVFGKRAPVLITAEMTRHMKLGSVIVDLAAEQGGNCALTETGKTVEKHGVTIVGAINLPALLPVDASLMYAKNISNLFFTVFPKNSTAPNFDDEITKGACITNDGIVINEAVRTALAKPKKETKK